VLLDEADEAAVADFGLAAELDVDETHRETQVKGTIGHIAPGLGTRARDHLYMTPVSCPFALPPIHPRLLGGARCAARDTAPARLDLHLHRLWDAVSLVLPVHTCRVHPQWALLGEDGCLRIWVVPPESSSLGSASRSLLGAPRPRTSSSMIG